LPPWPPFLQLRQHRQPELGALGFGQPQAQQLFLPFHINAQGKVHRLVDDALVLPDLQDDAVHVNNGVRRIDGSALQLNDSLQHAVRDLRNQGG
jgi:hypothetical protein